MFDVRFSNSAAGILEKLYKTDRQLYSRLLIPIQSLSKDPYQGKRLKGQFKGDYSLRVGDYRVIYTIHSKELIVYVIDLGHRSEIYR
jgi:mRNA interferase RelE/StbE